MPYFSGSVSRVVFRSADNSFVILSMLLDSETKEGGEDSDPFSEDSSGSSSLVSNKLVTVKGYVPGLSLKSGTWFGFEARWVDDPKYGRQLQITKAPVYKNYIDTDAVLSLLEGEGVPSVTLALLRNTFRDRLYHHISKSESLQKKLNLSPFEASFIVDSWESALRRIKALEYLSDLSLPNAKASEIWARFGSDTHRIVTEEPWALVSIGGIEFSSMDKLAEKAGLSLNNPSRYKYAAVYSISKALNPGDLYVDPVPYVTEIKKTLRKSFTSQDVKSGIQAAISENLIVLDRFLGKKFYDPWQFYLEDEATKLLVHRHCLGNDYQHRPALKEEYRQALLSGVESLVDSDVAERPLDDVISAVIEATCKSSSLSLSSKQRQAIYNALTQPVSILTGLPGTGKSTSTKVLVRILQRAQIPFSLMAPTGIAAKRLAVVSGAEAATIHKTLEASGWDDGEERESTYAGIVGSKKTSVGVVGEGESWGYCEGKPLPAKFIIVDEFSMVDQHMLYRILAGTRADASLVFIGDAEQLPSVGAGNVLRELLYSGIFPVVSLKKIFRQEDTSDIVTAAHSIVSGIVPDVEVGSDFTLLPVKSEEQAVKLITKLSQKLYSKLSSDDSENKISFQVLSPKHMGDVGVTNLNSVLRSELNPRSKGKREAKLAGKNVREGDRVMVVKNNYTLGVFNGDTGKILSVDSKNKSVVVKIHGTPSMEVDFSLYEGSKFLRMAYACTVHKYQGLEVDVIIMPLMPSFGPQLQRNLLYTAVTRAKRKVILVGTKKALEIAVLNSKENHRNTILAKRLEHYYYEFIEPDSGFCKSFEAEDSQIRVES